MLNLAVPLFTPTRRPLPSPRFVLDVSSAHHFVQSMSTHGKRVAFVEADCIEIDRALVDVLRGGKYFALSVTTHPPTTEKISGDENGLQGEGGAERVVHFHIRRLKTGELWRVRFRKLRYGKVVIAL